MKMMQMKPTSLRSSLLTLAAVASIAVALCVPVQARDSQSPPSVKDTMGWLAGTWETLNRDEGTKMSFQWAAGREVLLWKGTYASDESTWSFVTTFFYDLKKERFRVFSFNSDGQRHLGALTHSGPGRLVWKMSGLRSDGQIESFVMEFLHGQNDTLVFSMAERNPGDADGSDNTALTLRRTSEVEEGEDS